MTNNPITLDLTPLIKRIMDKIFLPDQQRIDRLIDKLIEIHCGKDENPTFYGLRLLNATLTHSSFQELQRAKRRGQVIYHAVKPEYATSAQKHYDDITKLKQDYAEIRQCLVLSVSGMKSVQDIRDVLPESIVDLIPELRTSYTRTREPGYCLTDKERKQTERGFKLIDSYLVAAMIF